MLVPNIKPTYQECLDHVNNLVKAKELIDPDFTSASWSIKQRQKLAEDIYLMHLAINGDEEIYEEVRRIVEKIPSSNPLSLEEEFRFKLAYDQVSKQ